MLDQILNFFKDSKEIKTLKELAKKLGIQPSALEGMLDFLVKKGKLKTEYHNTSPLKGCSKRSPACVYCPGKDRGGSTPGIRYYYLAN